MNIRRWTIVASATLLLISIAGPEMALAQVGKSQGLLDANTASEKELLALPHVDAKVAKTILEARPFGSITALNKHLLDQKLTQAQANEIYAKAFIHINLNTATREEILLIPGAGRKMAHEFDEYRPWKTWSQFDKEIGKYVGKKETARLAQYCFIPLNVNKATDEDLASIPGLTQETIKLIAKGKPWKSINDLEKELAKTAGDKEAKRIARYLVAV